LDQRHGRRNTTAHAQSGNFETSENQLLANRADIGHADHFMTKPVWVVAFHEIAQYALGTVRM